MEFPGHFDQIFQQLNYQRLHGQLCDCVIVVGSQHFKAHRSVLAACSTHFRALFTVAEGDGGVNMIQLDSEVVTAEAFSALMDMMYTSTLMLGESNVMDVLLAASHLHLNAVVKACKHYLTTRTLPLSPAGDLPGHVQDQHAMAAGSRLQRSFLLQQLGLSLVSSALSANDEGSASLGTGAEVEQRASFPIRRFHKRKPSLSVVSPEERPRHRPRASVNMEEAVRKREGSEDMGDGDFVSPDSKLDTGIANDVDGSGGISEETYLAQGAQDEAQVPSQSDGGCGQDQELQGKGEYAGIAHQVEGVVIKVKEGAEADEQQQMQVVVKSEPLSSPEPLDETSDVTSQAECSDQVEPGADKAELSPEGSERSFSDPQSSTDRVAEIHVLEGGTGRAVGEAEGGAASSDGLDAKQGFSAPFLVSKGYSTAALKRRPVVDDNLPNTTTAECGLDREGNGYLRSPESVSGSSSLLYPGIHHAHQQLLQGEAHPFGEMQTDFFLRPMQDGLGFQRTASDQFPLDYQRSSLGLHSMSRGPRGGGSGASMGFPAYRRIAPKMPPHGSGGTVHEDGASSSSSTACGTLLGGPAYGGQVAQRGAPAVAPPPLTRASADVLSKCKKALSEHNVLVVEGARKYACKICCKTFLTLTDCKKHIRVHTGEKPYACLKCGKRFSQSSHLYKHSKTTCLRWQNSNLSSALL